MSNLVTSAEFATWDIVQITTQLGMLDGFWGQYTKAHEQLISLANDDAEIDTHQDAMVTQLDVYTNASIVMKRKLRDLELATQNATAAVNAANGAVLPNGIDNGGAAQNGVQAINADGMNRFLEKIKVPKFNGEQHRWLPFYESFKSMVHDRNFSSVEKFHYLYNSLTERARNVIGGLDTAESYDEAWTTLVKRYDNKRIIVNAHLQHFIGHQVSSRPNSDDLLALVDVTLVTIRSLRTLEVPIDQWDAIMVFLISRKLDDKTRDFWEIEQKSTDIPKLQDMLDCIEGRARTLQLAEETKGSVKPTPVGNQRPGQNRQRATVHTTVASSNAATTTSATCLLCKQDHWIHGCPQLSSVPAGERFKLIKGIPNLCFNCLRVGHMKNECRSSGCKHCNLRHNSILCRRQPSSSDDAFASTSNNN